MKGMQSGVGPTTAEWQKNKKREKNSDVKKETNLEAKDRAKDLQLGQGQDQEPIILDEGQDKELTLCTYVNVNYITQVVVSVHNAKWIIIVIRQTGKHTAANRFKLHNSIMTKYM